MKQNGYVSFIYPVSAGATLQLPFWVLDFCEATHEVVSAKGLWRTAVQWIQSKGEVHREWHGYGKPWGKLTGFAGGWGTGWRIHTPAKPIPASWVDG